MAHETKLVVPVAVPQPFLVAALEKLNAIVLGNMFDIRAGKRVEMALKGDDMTKFNFTIGDYGGQSQNLIEVFCVGSSALNAWWNAVLTHKLAALLWQGSILHNEELREPLRFGISLPEWNEALDPSWHETNAYNFWEYDVKRYGNLPATKKLVQQLKKYFPKPTND